MDISKSTLNKTITAAEDFLIRNQSSDGFWRDYQLEPGASEAWTTATVLWSLVNFPRVVSKAVIKSALSALRSVQTTKGWGYNRYTAPDADTTSWVVRTLTMCNIQLDFSASECLRLYLLPEGLAQTFLDRKRFGSWATAHADVTPMVGLALTSINESAQPIRNATLKMFEKDGIWKSFWWSCEAYSIARNLEFLSITGGIPNQVISIALEWLSNAKEPVSAFESAQYLFIAILLDTPLYYYKFTEQLIASQLNDSSWAPSKVLLVPNQVIANYKNKDISVPKYQDERRILTTATVTSALKFLSTRL